MNCERQGFHISHVYSLWQDLSRHSIILDLVTFTLKFDLLFKNFNLGHNIWTVRDGAFILHMCIPCDKTVIFDLVIHAIFFWGHLKGHKDSGTKQILGPI